jgi:hypothetical protein
MSLKEQQRDFDEYILLVREKFIKEKENSILDLVIEKRIKELEIKHPEYLDD